MSGSVAVFNWTQWSFRFPDLAANVSPGTAAAYFAEASLYVDSTATSLITDPVALGLIMNLATAHIAMLNAPDAGQPPSPLVGRIGTASEGSVSVSMAAMAIPGTAEWWATSRYGLAAWAALAPYRTAQYVPGPGACRPAQTWPWPFYGQNW